MAIYLGVPPERDFDRLPRDYSRDPKISGLAKAVLWYLLGHRDGYQLTVKQMTAEFKEGEDALYAAIKELIEAGYVRRVQYRGGRGRTGAVHYLVIGADGEFPQVDCASGFSGSVKPGSGPTCDDAEFSQVSCASGVSGSAIYASGGSGTKKNRDKKNTNLEDQEDQRSGVERPTADAARAPNFEIPSLVGEARPTGRQGFTDWRGPDFDRFLVHVGSDHITSDGSLWTEGTHPTEAFYLAFQKWKRPRQKELIDWPGLYLDRISENEGVENYLDKLGLTPA